MPALHRDLLHDVLFFFFNDTATTEIYTLSLHDALPICRQRPRRTVGGVQRGVLRRGQRRPVGVQGPRSEEHTSELQSPCNLVCRLLLEKTNPLPRPTHPQTSASRQNCRTLSTGDVSLPR